MPAYVKAAFLPAHQRGVTLSNGPITVPAHSRKSFGEEPHERETRREYSLRKTNGLPDNGNIPRAGPMGCQATGIASPRTHEPRANSC
eukprot:5118848-Pyramimonas_sp.AAC.1